MRLTVRVVRSGIIQTLLAFLNDFFTGFTEDDVKPGPDEPAPPVPLFLLVSAAFRLHFHPLNFTLPLVLTLLTAHACPCYCLFSL